MLQTVLNKRTIGQQHKQWYVLDDEFTWNVTDLHQRIFHCLQQELSIPVIFCDTCEANKIVSELGEEEAEWLQYASGLYWREVGIIFIFRFDDYLPLVETLFHELRHVIQETLPEFHEQFEKDRHVPYMERLTEIDAFSFAAQQLQQFTEEWL